MQKLFYFRLKSTGFLTFHTHLLPQSKSSSDIPVIFQIASLLAALTHPGHIVIYAPGDSLPCRREAS
ncbi:hypothetical protein [Photorhabdus australis]|uniref:hypothetical protein n=1 Tax=Photorhabdus australis TaxID=286156 RepID=UPI0030D9DA7F